MIEKRLKGTADTVYVGELLKRENQDGITETQIIRVPGKISTMLFDAMSEEIRLKRGGFKILANRGGTYQPKEGNPITLGPDERVIELTINPRREYWIWTTVRALMAKEEESSQNG